MANNPLIMALADKPAVLARAKRSRAPRKAEDEPAAPPDPSLMRKVGAGILSPIEMIGNVIDTPGSMVRDTIGLAGGGSWDKYNPFDQLASMHTSDNRVSGRDLLRAGGHIGQKDTWGNFAGGLAAEIALDPTTYLTGIVGGLGKALQGTGKATHLAKFTMPFTHAELPFGKALASNIDNLSAAAQKSQFYQKNIDPAVRLGGAMFDYSTLGALGKGEQAYNRRRVAKVETDVPGAHQAALESMAAMSPVKQQFLKEFGNFQDGEKAWNQVMHHTLEVSKGYGSHSKGFESALWDVQSAHGITGSRRVKASPQLVKDAEKQFQRFSDDYERAIKLQIERGVPINKLDSTLVGYAARSGSADWLKRKGKEATTEGLFTHTASLPRKQMLKHVPQLYIDHMIGSINAAGKRTYDAAKIKAHFGPYLGYTRRKKGVKGGIVVTADQHAKALEKWIQSLPSDVKSVHELAPAGLFERHQLSSARVTANADAAHDAFKADHVLDPMADGYTLRQAYQKIGLRSKEASDWFGNLNKYTPAQLKDVRVGRSTVDAIVNTKKVSSWPPFAKALGEGVDSFNRVFKGSVTLPFPAFHIRNFLSGQHMNLASEHLRTPGDFANYIKSMKEAEMLWRTGDSDPLMREIIAHKVHDQYRTLDDVELPTPGKPKGGTNSLTDPWDLKSAWQQAGEHVDTNAGSPLTSWMPKFARQSIQAPLSAGANVARYAEFMNRVPMYIYLKKKGLSPGQAAQEVTKLQFDYSKMTPFEKGFMRRLVPFYGFTRNIVPQIASMLIDRPGGKMGQTLRAIAAGKSDEDFLPAHIADSAAIPLGTTPTGDKRYLTGLGLAPEAAVPYLSAPMDARGAGMNAGAALTPFLKGPLEYVTNQSFFQRGRKLSDMDPSLGRTAANILEGPQAESYGKDNRYAQIGEQIASNSPFSKWINLAKTATDARKDPWERVNNVVSPLRKYDVSPKQQEKVLLDAAQKLADELGARKWESFYFTKEQITKLEQTNPLLAEEAKALKSLMGQSKKKARDVKKELSSQK